ncbi:MAG TPA: glutathionylspermidine synthase family protein [Pseudonocardiaceae bacterium]|jgi:glutathionylspermidine synthase|nr:glutathionylspermidine synthase family protein [Pseudonocardiaceae bacterium]
MGWRTTIQGQGVSADGPGGRPRWDESAHYVLEPDEVAALRADAELLHSMCLEAVDTVVTTERYRDFGLPEWAWPALADSWKRRDPHLCGRFDFRYDGGGPAKLLEYNADAPTTLVEAAVAQWSWRAAVFPDGAQWNDIHRRLVARWTELTRLLPSGNVHFTWSGADPTGADRALSGYLGQTAADAGCDAVALAIEDVGWDTMLHRFVDLEDAPISTVAKVYPWEWVVGDRFGRNAIDALPDTLWIEPLWKLLLADKALLAVLWEMYPGHPNLLPTFLDEPGMLTEYVRKPKLGRDGANIQIIAPGYETRTAGVYGQEGHVCQLFDPLPEFDGRRPAVGVWIVGDQAVGLGVRESVGLVTDEHSVFVPHRVGS